MSISKLTHPDGTTHSYSLAATFGELIFTCGQVGVDPGGPPLAFEEEVRIALKRLLDVVRAAGGSQETVLKVNGYLLDLADFPIYDRIYREVFIHVPRAARTTVQVGAFPHPIRIEVDAIAAIAKD